jgi:hypothetical protein
MRFCRTCNDYVSDEELSCEDCQSKTLAYQYVNVYAVTRHYGGPEEGGWWWNYHEPLSSYLLSENEDPDEISEQLYQKYKDLEEGNIYSVNGGVAIEVYKEFKFAEAYPKTKPYYE